MFSLKKGHLDLKLPYMQYKMLRSFLIILMVLRVECKMCLKDAYSDFINERYTDCKVNFFTNKLWSYVDCMKHCKKLGGRAIPVRNPQEWKEMDEVVEELRAHTPAPDMLYLSVTRGEVDEVTDNDIHEKLTLEHWPKETREAKQDVWRDYYTGEEVENSSRSVGEGNFHCAGKKLP